MKTNISQRIGFTLVHIVLPIIANGCAFYSVQKELSNQCKNGIEYTYVGIYGPKWQVVNSNGNVVDTISEVSITYGHSCMFEMEYNSKTNNYMNIPIKQYVLDTLTNDTLSYSYCDSNSEIWYEWDKRMPIGLELIHETYKKGDTTISRNSAWLDGDTLITSEIEIRKEYEITINAKNSLSDSLIIKSFFDAQNVFIKSIYAYANNELAWYQEINNQKNSRYYCRIE